MFILNEGEIIFKEKYGSSGREIFYVKPLEQTNVTVLDRGQESSLFRWFCHIFLPQGYPDSVSKDYTSYQLCDTAQAFCSTITGTLATQEVLRGVGVGSSATTPLAATITWVIKDGCGHLGRIFFAYSHGTYLDAYSKKWRLYADTLNDAAMCIEIALPLFKNYTTFALCVSTTMKAIVGVAGGATRAALTQHHAIRGNLADVSAKDAAQETAVNLVASVTALLLITMFGNSVLLFMVMIMLHITFNYLAVRAVCLKTLNEPRFLQLIDAYLKHEVIVTPCQVNKHEPILFYQFGANILDYRVCGFHIKLGCSIQRSALRNSKFAYFDSIRTIYKDRKYMLCPEIGTRTMYVLLREHSTTDDILSAYFHAVLFSVILCAINNQPLNLTHKSEDLRPFADVCLALQEADWTRDLTENTGNSGFLYEPSHILTKFVDDMVAKEWPRVRRGLHITGWDCSRHLIMVDEWRISSDTIDPKEVRLTDDSEPVLPLDAPSSILSFGDYSLDLHQPHAHGAMTFTIEPDTHRASSDLQLPRSPTVPTLSEQTEQNKETSSQEVPSPTPTQSKSKTILRKLLHRINK